MSTTDGTKERIPAYQGTTQAGKIKRDRQVYQGCGVSHTFILHPNRADIRQACHDAIRALPDDKPWKVIISEHVKDRTIPQNSGYWGYVITPAALQKGYESNELLHKHICCELYGTHNVAFRGQVYIEPNRTTTHPKVMSKAEFNEHTERAAALLIADGVTLPAKETWFS